MRRVLGLFVVLMSILLFASCDTVTGLLEEHGDAKSSNALLKELTVSEGVWEYDFNKYDTEYSITVSNEIDSIQVKPKTDHVFATVTVEGVEVDSGSNSDPIDLIATGLHTITVIVTAWDGSQKTYTLSVTKNLSTVTSLSSFAIIDPIGVTLNNTGSNNYSAVVGTDIQTIRFSITATHPEAVIEMTLSHNGSVTVGNNVILNSGLNSFLIKVTAEDGFTKEYYTAEITKLSGDATDCKVNSLSIERTSLAPAFDVDDHNGEASYNFSAEISEGKLSNGELTTNLVLVTNSGIAKTTITDASGVTPYIEGGQITHKLNASDFGARETPYNITVYVESGGGPGNSVTYNIALTVRAGNNDAKLTNGDGVTLTWGAHNSQTVVYPGTFASHTPTTYGFLSGYYEYIAVMYATDVVTVTAKANDPNAASITINGETGAPDSNGEFSKAVSLSIGYVTDVTIDVKAEDNTTTASYTIRIRALNVYEYYWGIYGPLNNKSFARWDDWKNSQGLTINATLPDLTGTGNLYWKTTTGPTTFMRWTNYNDGNSGGGSFNIRTDYNYNHPTNANLDGFVLGEGETYGELQSLTNRDGFVYGGFTLETPWGDDIAEVMVHYWINDMLKEVCSASWAEILYMGVIHKMMYATPGSGPNPFTDPTFDWESPWIPAGYPLSGFPTAPASDWTWHKQYDNPPSESKPSDCDS